MFDLFKKKKPDQPGDVKSIRNNLVQFVKEQLQRWEGGEGSYIKGMQLFLAPPDDEMQLYETAVFAHEPDRFRNEEVQKIADDYAIALPAEWTLALVFTPELPSEARRSQKLPAALHIVTNKQPVISKPRTGRISVLNGEAERNEYLLNTNSGKVCIGRDRNAQTSEGFFRLNTIAFPADSTNNSNKFVSRQHAHIEWNTEAGCFYLFADEGGIPPRNKVKVQTAAGELVKLQTTQVGHPLQDGDQIILGDAALLQFNYVAEE